MCGIFGYIGQNFSSRELAEGIEKLEYRGYDSCGVAAWNGKKLLVKKMKGRVARLKEEFKHYVPEKIPLGIFHTRWATHGNPSRVNAHPHLDCTRTLAVVHNGIIENYSKLKEKLIGKGHR